MASLYESLTTNDGTGINFGRLAAVMTGLVASAFGGGVAEIVEQTFVAWLIRPLQGLATFFGTLYELPGRLSIALIGSTVSSSVEFVESLGLLGIFASVAILGLTGFAVGWVIRRA